MNWNRANWKRMEEGWAQWSDDQHGWMVRLRPQSPPEGIFLGIRGTGYDDMPVLRLMPPWSGSQRRLLDESYFRGPDCVALLPPQPDCPYGLQICHRVIASDEDHLVIETVISIQTDLLDSHPTVDLVSDAPAHPVAEITAPAIMPGAVSLAGIRRSSTPPPLATWIGSAAEPTGAVVLLPPSDAAAAAQISASGPLRYQLLAEFLEKGVIRKARFWICRWRVPPRLDQIERAYLDLCDEPLPLTP